MTTHFPLAPRFKEEYSYTSTPPLSLLGLLRGKIYFAAVTVLAIALVFKGWFILIQFMKPDMLNFLRANSARPCRMWYNHGTRWQCVFSVNSCCGEISGTHRTDPTTVLDDVAKTEKPLSRTELLSSCWECVVCTSMCTVLLIVIKSRYFLTMAINEIFETSVCIPD
jgi:hypothetical protein